MEAALTSAPDDEELQKLKKDLEEVIDLTTELIKSQLPDHVKKDGMLTERRVKKNPRTNYLSVKIGFQISIFPPPT